MENALLHHAVVRIFSGLDYREVHGIDQGESTMLMERLQPFCLFMVFSPGLSLAASSVINVSALTWAPQLDGVMDEGWQQAASQAINLQPNSDFSASDPVTQIQLRAGHYEGRVYFLLEWADATEDRMHKPYVWNRETNRYGRGSQREDRLALQFHMSGDYQANWLTSDGFIADMWHWKASRSDPLGLADDKWTKVSRDRLVRSSKISAGGEHIYVLRQWDAGDSLYTTRRYRKYSGDIKPKYILNTARVEGSTADVKAAGRWADGRWVLELSRKLDTGHSDDARFELGQDILGGISVFNQSESEQHFISATQRFRFLP